MAVKARRGSRGGRGVPAEPLRFPRFTAPRSRALDAACPLVVLLENQMPSQAFQTPRVKQDQRRSRGAGSVKASLFISARSAGSAWGALNTKTQSPRPYKVEHCASHSRSPALHAAGQSAFFFSLFFLLLAFFVCVLFLVAPCQLLRAEGPGWRGRARPRPRAQVSPPPRCSAQ